VNFEDYNPDAPLLSAAGRLDFSGVTLCAAGLLTIRLLDCPGCPGATDQNAILNAVLIEPAGDGTPNNPPNAQASATPTTALITDGEALVTLDGSGSNDGDDGAQGITYEWTQVDPPNPAFGGSTFATPDAAMTEVVIRQGAGTYRFRLDIDDGQLCDNSASVEVEVEVIAGVLFVRGDVDSSGTVELTDGVIALGFLFSGGPPPACFDSADVDDGGSVELTDAVIIFTWLFLGGPPPQAPTPSATTYPGQDCGIDPVDDALDCAVAGAVCS
jgi:hypothetical protein